MAMSKQSNRNMTKRWEAAIAAKEKEQVAIHSTLLSFR